LLTAAATGAVGVVAAQTAFGATAANAGTDGDVVLGAFNTETHNTAITNTTKDQNGLDVVATGAGVAVTGQSDANSGVAGVGTPGVFGLTVKSGSNGVWGEAGQTSTANGVYGHASNSGASGVYGLNDGTGFGVAGRAHNGTGVLGDSQAGTGMSASTVTGTALEVIAGGTGGTGMHSTDGGSGNGPAVVAKLTNPANPSPAVLAETDGTGPAIYARSGAGVALHVAGKVTFSRSGLATIRAGSKTVTVRMAGVNSSSLILATLHRAAGSIAVASAVPGSGSFTINLSRAPATNIQVAYLVLG